MRVSVSVSRVTGIPAFVVGFVLTPLASNSSEFVSSLRFAARKRRKNMSLTFSQVRGCWQGFRAVRGKTKVGEGGGGRREGKRVANLVGRTCHSHSARCWQVLAGV